MHQQSPKHHREQLLHMRKLNLGKLVSLAHNDQWKQTQTL